MRLSPERQAVLRLLHASPHGLPIGELAQRLGKAYDRTKLYLWRMAQDGLIEMDQGRYRVRDDTHETSSETRDETSETPAETSETSGREPSETFRDRHPLQVSPEVSDTTFDRRGKGDGKVSPDMKPHETSPPSQVSEVAEAALLRAQLGALHQDYDRLRQDHERLWQQMEASREHWRQEREEDKEASREQIRIAQSEKQRLMNLLDAEQHEKRLLLEAPRPATSTTQSPRMLAAMPESWQVILRHLQGAGPQRPEDVRRALAWPQSPRHAMKRMWQAGVLVRVQHGLYALPEQAR